MNAYSPPVRIVADDPWKDIPEDEGMAPMPERIARSRAAVAMLDALPPAPELVVDEAACDEAFGRLLGALLSDEDLAVIARQHARFAREGNRL